MKIKTIEPFVLTDTLEETFYFSQWVYSERQICLVRITLDDGTTGWGEGYGPAGVIAEGIRLLGPLLEGQDPLENERLWFEMYRKTLDYARRGVLVASISAIDNALWDLKGKLLNKPIHTLLGGAHRSEITPYATGLYFSESDNLAEKLAEEAKGYVEEGFQAVKMKVGHSIQKDQEFVHAVREAIGEETALMVDANHAYSLRDAAELARKIEPYEIGWFEEPVSPELYDHYRQLRSKTCIPIAGGECEYLRYGFKRLLENESVDILQLDLCSCGGLTEAKRIAALAATHGVEVVPHTWGTGIAFHIALHFIANLEPVPGRLLPPEAYIEYDRTENKIRETLTHPKVSIQEGQIAVPNRPGLGIEVDEDTLEQFL